MPEDNPGQPAAEPSSEPQSTPAAEPATPSASAPPTETPPDISFTNFIEADGKLKSGWKDNLPEEMRHELSLDTFDSIPEAMRQLISAQRMIGKDKVVIPNDKSSQAEIDAFYNAIGRPESPDKYEYQAPNDIDIVDFSPETMKPIFEDLHKSGMTQNQLNVAMGHFHNYVKGLQEQVAQEEEQEFQAAEAMIKEELGESLDDMQHHANLLIAENSPNEEFKSKLLEAVNDNNLRPLIFSFLGNVHKKHFSQHDGMPPSDGPAADGSPAALEAKAKELMETPGYMDGTMKNQSPEQYKRLTSQITELYNKAGKKFPA